MPGIEFDQIILVCNGCKGERIFYPDRPLRGAQELIEWINTKTTRCSCGAKTCDVKAHMKGDPCLSCGMPKIGEPDVDCSNREFHQPSPSK